VPDVEFLASETHQLKQVEHIEMYIEKEQPPFFRVYLDTTIKSYPT